MEVGVTAVAEGSTEAVVEDFMAVAEEGSAGVEVSTAEGDQGSAADAASADIVAATSEGGVSTVVAGVSGGASALAEDSGAEDLGAEDSVADGAGDLALGGRIGAGDMDIPMATATARGITRPTLIILTRTILTRTTVLRTIPRAILIPATGTTILHRQIPMYGLGPTRTDRQDPGDPRYRKVERMQTTETATLEPLRRTGGFSPLTG